MPHVNMMHLRTFLVMVEEKSYEKTARSLDLSEQSVRNYIANLEKTVGKRLLGRRVPANREERGRTQLTEAGHLFLPRAIAALQAHDRMFDDIIVAQDPRTVANALAAALLEMARAVLTHDMPEEEVKWVYKTVLRGPREEPGD